MAYVYRMRTQRFMPSSSHRLRTTTRLLQISSDNNHAYRSNLHLMAGFLRFWRQCLSLPLQASSLRHTHRQYSWDQMIALNRIVFHAALDASAFNGDDAKCSVSSSSSSYRKSKSKRDIVEGHGKMRDARTYQLAQLLRGQIMESIFRINVE